MNYQVFLSFNGLLVIGVPLFTLLNPKAKKPLGYIIELEDKGKPIAVFVNAEFVRDRFECLGDL